MNAEALATNVHSKRKKIAKSKSVFITMLLLYPFLQILSQNTSSFKRLTNVIDSYPMFSPDGKKSAFESNRTGNFEIYTMDIHGTRIKQLTYDAAFDGTPAWSPDGKQIVFASERDNDPEIYIMNPDGSNQKRLTNIKGDDSHPKFTPDGKKNCFLFSKINP